jgi:hypothetical protein
VSRSLFSIFSDPFYSSHRAVWRGFALRAVGNLARALCRFVPRHCLSLFLRAAVDDFDQDQALREVQLCMIGQRGVLELQKNKEGQLRVVVPPAYKSLFAGRTSLAALQRVDMARFSALRDLVLPALSLPYVFADARAAVCKLLCLGESSIKDSSYDSVPHSALVFTAASLRNLLLGDRWAVLFDDRRVDSLRQLKAALYLFPRLDDDAPLHIAPNAMRFVSPHISALELVFSVVPAGALSPQDIVGATGSIRIGPCQVDVLLDSKQRVRRAVRALEAFDAPVSVPAAVSPVAAPAAPARPPAGHRHSDHVFSRDDGAV